MYIWWRRLSWAPAVTDGSETSPNLLEIYWRKQHRCFRKARALWPQLSAEARGSSIITGGSKDQATESKSDGGIRDIDPTRLFCCVALPGEYHLVRESTTPIKRKDIHRLDIWWRVSPEERKNVEGRRKLTRSQIRKWVRRRRLLRREASQYSTGQGTILPTSEWKLYTSTNGCSTSQQYTRANVWQSTILCLHDS